MRGLVTTVLLLPLAACAAPTPFDRGLADLCPGRYAGGKAPFDAAPQASAAALPNRGAARARPAAPPGAGEGPAAAGGPPAPPGGGPRHSGASADVGSAPGARFRGGA